MTKKETPQFNPVDQALIRDVISKLKREVESGRIKTINQLKNTVASTVNQYLDLSGVSEPQKEEKRKMAIGYIRESMSGLEEGEFQKEAVKFLEKERVKLTDRVNNNIKS